MTPIFLTMWYRKRFSWHFIDRAAGRCAQDICPGITVRRTGHQFKPFGQHVKIKSLCVPHMRKHNPLYGFGNDIMLRRCPAVLRGRRGRRGTPDDMGKIWRWNLHINGSSHDKRSLYFICGILHRRTVWISEALSGKRHRSTLFQPGTRGAVLVLQSSRIV